MKKFLKSITSIALAVILAVGCMVTSFAATEENYCTATIDGNFSDNSFSVFLTNEESLKFKTYTTEDFSEVNAISVKTVASYTYPYIRLKYAATLAKEINITDKDYTLDDFNRLLYNDDNKDLYETDLFKCIEERIIPSLNAKDLENNYLYTKEQRKNLLILELDKYINELEENNKYLKKFDYSTYRCSLSIEIPSNDKQKVLDAIHTVEVRDEIEYASPNWNYTFSDLDEGEHSDKIYIDWGLPMGDINYDGKINIIDVTLIQKHIAQLITLTPGECRVADINKDGTVSVLDVLEIQRIIARLF